jgi:hypothetical protein
MTMMVMTMMMMMIMIMIMNHIYIYILKVHRHGISKIRNPSAIPARSNVRVAPKMFKLMSIISISKLLNIFAAKEPGMGQNWTSALDSD